ncbi:nucleoside triphosphate pyrophosphohydrolase/pyrophosphatase MazG [Oxobacter pfennigii]|uniref:Nucleoside triphosphate pyrophosphohydrolase/pyrophosphatase MazG n=1 Tax=Oxobacter pfennigii TaxID=36849 RepID=A0A0P8W2P0_9CLOT|nr:nucleoside triphosphate pyrophosphohydrolase [Oxobacter pfennigii]KPU42781.1 nucleoside triphosphate pyrophosphohydrolase/pyrophosphatase MazG [Oxobacter pfennigii]
MGNITIVGLGPGSFDDLTLRAVREMENAKAMFLRTRKHPTVEYIEKLGLIFKSFDEEYDTLSTFEDVYMNIAQKIIEAARIEDVVYAVPGHPLVAEDTVQRILKISEDEGIKVSIVSSVSFIDAVIGSLSIDPIEGLKVLDGLQIKEQKLDTASHNIITQVYNRRVASDVKLKLMEQYEDETQVILIKAAGVPGLERIEPMPLYEIDRAEWVDYLTSLYVPPINKKKRYEFEDLISVMERLRGEDGCPWDKEQTHESLKQYLIEESYEVLEAIDEGDIDKFCEELGDVLLQVVFHASIAMDRGDFDITDVTDRITDKMIKRHTHIFGSDICDTPDQVVDNWEEIKKKEQGFNTVTDTLRHVPKNLPALMRSYKVQDKAARVGFDWDSVEGALLKVNEEIREFLDVYKSENYGKIEEELGDLLFAVVNVCRFQNVMPEFALNGTTEKFIKRFSYIEREAISQGKKMEKMTLEEMDALWNAAKMNNFLKSDKN